MSNIPEMRCPKCGSYDIEWIKFQSFHDDDLKWFEWRCECYKCHTRFRVSTAYRAIRREIEIEEENND